MAIRSDRHDGPRTTARHEMGFVAGLVRSHQDLVPVRHEHLRRLAATPVSATQDGNTVALGDQSLDDVHDDRRFTCPAHGEIADADHGAGQPARL
jgi:hypothetical protein